MIQLSIIIPVFNEAKTVEELLRSVFSQEVLGLTRELIIVESHSTDGTRDKVEKFYEQHAQQNPHVSLRLILQDRPLGKGNAVREGLRAATGEIVLIQDGDLEYDVKDYPALVEPILRGQTKFVLGSRHLGAGSWKIRRFERNLLKSALLNLGGVFFHGLFNILYNQKLTDPTTMYKVFRRECLSGLRLEANRFDFDFEILGKLLRRGYVPLEVPVNYVSRGFEDGKKIRVFRDPLTWVRAVFKYRYTSIQGAQGLGFHSSLIYLILGISVFFYSLITIRYYGGLLTSPDSISYLRAAGAPWQALGHWHPPGVSFLLYFSDRMGLGSSVLYAGLAVILALLFFSVFDRAIGKKWAFLLLLGLLLDPSFLMLRITLWSEIPFLVVITSMGILLTTRRIGRKCKIFLSIILLLIAIQIRYVGLFFLPALILSMAADGPRGRKAFGKRLGISAILVVSFWMLSNRLISGRWLHTTTANKWECKSLLVSLNSFPYCTWEPTLPICQLDPERKSLNQSRLEFRDLVFLWLNPESPISRYVNADPEEACVTTRKVATLVLQKAPISFVTTLCKRAWGQFGRWNETERADAPFIDPEVEARLKLLDQNLSEWNRSQNLFRVLLIFVMASLLWFRRVSPLVIFFGLGALGHAAGVSLANPFLALRYMAISKYLIFICAILMLAKWIAWLRTRIHFFGKPSQRLLEP